MAKNYLDRYVWLIDTVNRHGHISKREIDELWYRSPLNERRDRELPERTFHNHRAAILETFSLEIKCDRALGYYIANSEDLDSDGIRRWLLESLSMNNMLNESRDLRDRILFERVPSGLRWLTVLVNAIKDRRAVEMTYQSFSRTEPKTFEAHPLCLKLFRQRWYLLALSEEHEEPRVYAFDRILDLKETKIRLKVPKRFDAGGYFSHFFGIIVDNRKPEIIRLKVYDDQVKYFRSLPLHGTQREEETTDKYSIFEYLLVPTFDFKQELLSKGPSVEVLAPDSFRAEMHADIKAMLKRYK